MRDRIPEIIAQTGRTPQINELRGEALRAALYDKLSEEHAELLEAREVAAKREELADLIEVAFALGAQYGLDEAEMLTLVHDKRAKCGGFEKGYFYKGDV